MIAPGSPALELRGVTRTYKQAGSLLPVLRGASLALYPGEIVALVAPSGASTLLHTAGLLERQDGGEVLLGGRSCGSVSEGQRTEIRRAQLGFVYQFHNLLPEFSALENVMLPQMITGASKAKARARALGRRSCSRSSASPRAPTTARRGFRAARLRCHGPILCRSERT